MLCATRTHPDAKWIYNEVRKIIPDISLGTVYRNINELIALGQVRRVSADGAADRFDADKGDHAHLVCVQCGTITDIDAAQVSVDYSLPDVRRCEVTLYGLCDKCRNRKI